MDVIDWLMDHGELWNVTLAEDGYDSYYPEYEEYFYKNESQHFSQQIAMVVMILLSKYYAQIFITNDQNKLLGMINNKDLEKIHNIITKVIVDNKDAVYILFTDNTKKQFAMGISGELSVTFANLPLEEKNYVKKLVNKVGLSLYLDKGYWK